MKRPEVVLTAILALGLLGCGKSEPTFPTISAAGGEHEFEVEIDGFLDSVIDSEKRKKVEIVTHWLLLPLGIAAREQEVALLEEEARKSVPNVSAILKSFETPEKRDRIENQFREAFSFLKSGAGSAEQRVSAFRDLQEGVKAIGREIDVEAVVNKFNLQKDFDQLGLATEASTKTLIASLEKTMYESAISLLNSKLAGKTVDEIIAFGEAQVSWDVSTDPGGLPKLGPQGLQGIAGAKGDAGLNFRGPWSSTENYSVSDGVFHEGAAWIAKRGNVGTAPGNIGGMVGYYPFDGNSMDASRNSNNAQLFGATFVADRNGNQGQALDLDGQGSRVEVVASPVFSDLSNYTVSMWVRLDTRPSVVPYFYHGVSSPHSRVMSVEHYYTSYNGGGAMTVGHNRGTTTGFTYKYLNFVPPVETWQLITVTYDGTDSKLYVDDTLTVSLEHVGTPEKMLKNLTFGRIYYAFPVNNYVSLDGQLDDVRVFNRALTAGEVARLYSADSQADLNTSVIGPPRTGPIKP